MGNTGQSRASCQAMDRDNQCCQHRENAYRDEGYYYWFSGSLSTNRSSDHDHVWQALTSCQISMPLHKLMKLLPRFKNTVASLTTGKELVHLVESGTGPPVMDSQNPVVKLVIKGRDVHSCIVDGASGVNVISEATYHNLDITQWEPCPFWLQMGRIPTRFNQWG